MRDKIIADLAGKKIVVVGWVFPVYGLLAGWPGRGPIYV